ncbi:E3 SUMO-protein ligase PIAS1, partial [Galemys pyrenaicus]
GEKTATTLVCPVCDKKAPYGHLIIGGLFMEILKYCIDCGKIYLKEDGSWVRDNQHYNTSLLAAAAAIVSDDQDLLYLSQFFPYTSSQVFLNQLSEGGSTSLPITNGSSSGSNSSLMSSNSLRESHRHAVQNRSSTTQHPSSASYQKLFH